MCSFPPLSSFKNNGDLDWKQAFIYYKAFKAPGRNDLWSRKSSWRNRLMTLKTYRTPKRNSGFWFSDILPLAHHGSGSERSCHFALSLSVAHYGVPAPLALGHYNKHRNKHFLFCRFGFLQIWVTVIDGYVNNIGSYCYQSSVLVHLHKSVLCFHFLACCGAFYRVAYPLRAFCHGPRPLEALRLWCHFG